MPGNQTELTAAQRYRARQLQVRADFLAEFTPLWSLVNPLELATTLTRWLQASWPLLRWWFDRSAQEATRYYQRAAPAPVDLPTVQLDQDHAYGALLIAGPGQVRRSQAAGLTAEQASDAGSIAAARSASRVVLGGGRDTLAAATKSDPRAQRYMRITDDDPCAFCAMLASRGAVYLTAEAAGDRLDRFHDGCGCAVVPVYASRPLLPATSQRFAELWETTTAGLSGDDARKAFRRAVDSSRAERPTEPDRTPAAGGNGGDGPPPQPPAATAPGDESPRRTELHQWLDLAGDIAERDDPNLDEDQVLAVLLREQRFDGRPRLVDERELDQLAAAGAGEPLWRGLFSEDRDAREYAEDFRTGELFVGRGVRGNGVYFARTAELAEMYAEPGGMIRALLPRAARTIAGDDLEDVAARLRTDPDLAGPLGPVLGDPGRLAAALGYDAVVWDERNLVVVLNRAALIVAR